MGKTDHATLRVSHKTVRLESYVTLRTEWSSVMRGMADSKWAARGHRVVDGRMEWRYFSDEKAAADWAHAIHEPDGKPDDTAPAVMWVTGKLEELFAGRKGHGGGPCTSRSLGQEALAKLLLEAYEQGRRTPCS